MLSAAAAIERGLASRLAGTVPRMNTMQEKKVVAQIQERYRFRNANYKLRFCSTHRNVATKPKVNDTRYDRKHKLVRMEVNFSSLSFLRRIESMIGRDPRRH